MVNETKKPTKTTKPKKTAEQLNAEIAQMKAELEKKVKEYNTMVEKEQMRKKQESEKALNEKAKHIVEMETAVMDETSALVKEYGDEMTMRALTEAVFGVTPKDKGDALAQALADTLFDIFMDRVLD